MVVRQDPMDFFKSMLLGLQSGSPLDFMGELTDLIKLDARNQKNGINDSTILGIVALVAIVAVVAVVAFFWITGQDKPAKEKQEYVSQIMDRLDDIEDELLDLKRKMRK